MFGAVAFLASQDWRDSDSSEPEVLAAEFDAYADQMAATLAGPLELSASGQPSRSARVADAIAGYAAHAGSRGRRADPPGTWITGETC
jgi:hypothetical protein